MRRFQLALFDGYCGRRWRMKLRSAAAPAHNSANAAAATAISIAGATEPACAGPNALNAAASAPMPPP
jgi:hypothetical protein